MKLRNKKTGKVINKNYPERFIINSGGKIYFYDSLAELNEEWEDYNPKEPLIKDEKIRQCVKLWAEACGLTHATYKMASNEFYDADTRGVFAIKFTRKPVEVYLEDGESFTIDELCGEEEE